MVKIQTIQFFFIIFFFTTINLFSAEFNLNKAFKYSGNISDKIIFLFDKNPISLLVPSKNEKESGKCNFFFPKSKISSKRFKCSFFENSKREIVAADDLYEIKCQEQSKPTLGLVFSVNFNPEKIGFEFKKFLNITGEQGVIFELTKKDVLKKMSDYSSLIRIYSFNEKIKPTVVLDCGHGGSDSGFSNGSIFEKNINLQIGLKAERLLKKKGYKVKLTRSHDESLELCERTRIANLNHENSVFISIHSNASKNKTVSGIETFYHQNGMQKRTYAMLDDRDDFIKQGSLCELDKFNKKLASCIHESVMKKAKTTNKSLIDRKIKKSPSQLLISSDIPSALIELGFLSNDQEGKLLSNNNYQDKLAQGIFDGINSFFNVSFS